MGIVDATASLERLEVFEERLGVSLDSLSAFVEELGSDNIYVTIRGQLQPRDGAELDSDVDLVVAVYDKDNRIIGTSSKGFYAEDFFGLETF